MRAAAPIKHWKDDRCYTVATEQCAACNAHGICRVLQNRAKALNHWSKDGSGKDAATIKDCPYSQEVAGLVEFARSENAAKETARLANQQHEKLQREKDRAARDIVKSWTDHLHRAIANVVVEEATAITSCNNPSGLYNLNFLTGLTTPIARL